jgi:hypothetical protein
LLLSGLPFGLSFTVCARVHGPLTAEDLRKALFRLLSIYGPTMGIFLAGHRILAVATYDGRMRCTFTARNPGAPHIVLRAGEIISSMSASQERATL